MFRWCALILVLLLSHYGPVDARVRTTADAIIVEVDLNDEREARSAKTPSGTYLLSEENRCWTSDGQQGVCSSLRSCYPGYQLTELKNFESLNELSIRGTCQYNRADGLQAYGVCCPRQGYFSTRFVGNFFGGGNPQFGVGSFPWLQPAGFPWWGAGGAGGGFPSYPSYPSIPAAPPAPVAPVDMGPSPTESWESWTEKPTTTQSWESWTSKPTESWESWTSKPTESWESWTSKPTESWESWTTKPTTTQSWETWTPSTTTPSTTTKPSWESWTTSSTKKPKPITIATTDKPIVTPPPPPPPDSGAKIACGKGPYRVHTSEQDRIVGGTTATPNSWPFQVSMQSNKRHFCGGSLINSQYILTAAHCIASFTSADVKKLEVVLAMHYTQGDTSGVRKRVSRLVRHKGYNAQTLYNDIAIMKLDSPATFGSTISTVCLPPASSSHSQHYGKDVTVIGWGSTRFQGSLPTALQQVTVKVQTNEECKRNYGTSAPGDILPSMICAGLPGKDSCQGDSGGPMIMQSGPGSPWTQVGVVSWGIECSKPPFPGVYTSVAHFIGWINTNAT